MPDEHKLGLQTARALRAEQLLNDDLFNEAIATIEADLIAAWKGSPARDTDGRERAWIAVQQVQKLKDYFRAVLDDGKIAARDLKVLAKSNEQR